MRRLPVTHFQLCCGRPIIKRELGVTSQSCSGDTQPSRSVPELDLTPLVAAGAYVANSLDMNCSFGVELSGSCDSLSLGIRDRTSTISVWSGDVITSIRPLFDKELVLGHNVNHSTG